MTEPYEGPEWGWCTEAGCTEAAEPLWFSGGFPDDPDLLLCHTHIGTRLAAAEAALAAQSATNAELLRRLAHEQSLVERGALLSVGVFRMVLLDIADKGMTIRELRRRLFLARKEQPDHAMTPIEVAAYINALVTDGPGRETLAEEAGEEETGGTDG